MGAPHGGSHCSHQGGWTVACVPQSFTGPSWAGPASTASSLPYTVSTPGAQTVCSVDLPVAANAISSAGSSCLICSARCQNAPRRVALFGT